MKVDRQVVKQTEITLKHLAKALRNGEMDSGKVGAYSRLLADYTGLIKLSQADEVGSSYYDEMEAQAIAESNSRQ